MQRVKHEDGDFLYELVRVYDDIHADTLISEDLHKRFAVRNNYLYRLKDKYEPYWTSSQGNIVMLTVSYD